MTARRSLALRREALAELGAGDLAGVAGGLPVTAGCTARLCVSVDLVACVDLSLDCYSWHTEEC